MRFQALRPVSVRMATNTATAASNNKTTTRSNNDSAWKYQFPYIPPPTNAVTANHLSQSRDVLAPFSTFVFKISSYAWLSAVLTTRTFYWPQPLLPRRSLRPTKRVQPVFNGFLLPSPFLLFQHDCQFLNAPTIPLPSLRYWQARRESNPQPAVLETAALPIELLA